jgi:hypothetical protein
MGATRPLDSIGSGPVVAWRFPRGPDTVQPPLLPDHQLRLLNWSRTSRRLASSALWFAALPYSLINVAGQTADAKNGVAKDAATVTLVSVVHIVGLVVTLCGLFWSLFIAETVLEFFASGDVTGLAPWALSTVVVLFVAVIFVRTVYLLRKGDTKLDAPRAWLAVVHVVVTAVFGAAVVMFPPSHWQFTAPYWLGLLTYPRPLVEGRMTHEAFCTLLADRPSEFGSYLNPVNSFMVASLGIAALCSFVLLIIAMSTHGGPARRASFAGAAMAVGGAVGLMHALAGSLRLAVDWILSYLDQFKVFGWIDRSTGLRRAGTLLRGYDPDCTPTSGEWFPDSFIGFAIVALFILMLALVVVNLIGTNRAVLPRALTTVEFFKYTHRLVGSIPHKLAVALFLAWIIWMSVIAFTVWSRFNGGAITAALIVITAHLGAFLSVAFLFFNGRARQIGATAADIIGFWPVRWHPLAGRSYRPPVVKGINEELDSHKGRRTVLVGHSQGSVISAWLISQRSKAPGVTLHLVTCGSPLHSLYEMFFPAYVNDDFYRDVAANVDSWTNFYRTTDPIGTAFGRPEHVTDVPLVDPPDPDPETSVAMPPPTRPLSHSNYWTDRTQMALLSELLQTTERTETDSQSGW